MTSTIQTMLAAGSLVALAACSPAAEQPEAPEAAAERPMPVEKASLLIQDPADAEFLSVPGVPECVTMAPPQRQSRRRGRLSDGADDGWMRGPPTHWHQTSEELIQLRGRPYMQLADGEPYYLETHSYSQLPGRGRSTASGAIRLMAASWCWLPMPPSTRTLSMKRATRIPTEDALAAAARVPRPGKW